MFDASNSVDRTGLTAHWPLEWLGYGDSYFYDDSYELPISEFPLSKVLTNDGGTLGEGPNGIKKSVLVGIGLYEYYLYPDFKSKLFNVNNEDWSFFVWVKPTVLRSPIQIDGTYTASILLSNGDFFNSNEFLPGAPDPVINNSFGVYLSDTGWVVEYRAHGYELQFNNTHEMSASVWTHVGFTVSVDPPNGTTVKFYKNGSYLNEDTATNPNADDSPYGGAIGYADLRMPPLYNHSGTNSFLGSMADVWWFNGTAVGPDVVKQIYRRYAA